MKISKVTKSMVILEKQPVKVHGLSRPTTMKISLFLTSWGKLMFLEGIGKMLSTKLLLEEEVNHNKTLSYSTKHYHNIILSI